MLTELALTSHVATSKYACSLLVPTRIKIHMEELSSFEAQRLGKAFKF